MKKRFLALMAAGLGTVLLLTACGHIGNITPDSKVKLNPNKPVSLTVWHYYNGAQQAAFDQLISEFNATEGKEKGPNKPVSLLFWLGHSRQLLQLQ